MHYPIPYQYIDALVDRRDPRPPAHTRDVLVRRGLLRRRGQGS